MAVVLLKNQTESFVASDPASRELLRRLSRRRSQRHVRQQNTCQCTSHLIRFPLEGVQLLRANLWPVQGRSCRQSDEGRAAVDVASSNVSYWPAAGLGQPLLSVSGTEGTADRSPKPRSDAFDPEPTARGLE